MYKYNGGILKLLAHGKNRWQRIYKWVDHTLHTGPTFRSRFTKKTNKYVRFWYNVFLSPCVFVSILGRFRHFESCVVLKGRKLKIVVARKENTRDYPFVPPSTKVRASVQRDKR